MAISTCPKCSNKTFELKENTFVRNSVYKLNFIQCSTCGAVVGTVDDNHIPSMLRIIADKIGVDLGD